MDDENLTFKPQINRKGPGITRQGQASVQPSMAGMQKYMERVNKAKKLKEEKQQLEEKAFNKGKNWTPSVTQPSAPKITAKRNQYLTGQ